MARVWYVFVREYLATVRTRAFLLAVLLVPVLGLGGSLFTLSTLAAGAGEERACAVIDRTGSLYERLEAAAQARNARAAEPLALGRVLLRREAPADPRHQLPALADEVLQGTLSAFVEIDAHVLDPDAPAAAVRYYASGPAELGLRRWLERTIEQEIHRLRLEQAGLAPDVVDRARRPVELLHLELPRDTGSSAAAAPYDPERDTLVPIAVALLLFLALMMGSAPLMQSVLEEKMHRIAEILVSSIPPFQLMMGKLLGGSAVSLTVLGVYAAAAAVALRLAGYSPPLGPAEVAWLLAFELVALLLYGSVFLAVGSACNDLKQSQALMLPVVLVLVMPLGLLQVVALDPSGPLSTALSLFPPFTPVLMMVRVTLPVAIPAWQPALGLVLSFAFAIGCVFAAGRIFRIGMLTQGATPRLRDLVRWAISG